MKFAILEVNESVCKKIENTNLGGACTRGACKDLDGPKLPSRAHKRRPRWPATVYDGFQQHFFISLMMTYMHTSETRGDVLAANNSTVRPVHCGPRTA